MIICVNYRTVLKMRKKCAYPRGLSKQLISSIKRRSKFDFGLNRWLGFKSQSAKKKKRKMVGKLKKCFPLQGMFSIFESCFLLVNHYANQCLRHTLGYARYNLFNVSPCLFYTVPKCNFKIFKKHFF